MRGQISGKNFFHVRGGIKRPRPPTTYEGINHVRNKKVVIKMPKTPLYDRGPGRFSHSKEIIKSLPKIWQEFLQDASDGKLKLFFLRGLSKGPKLVTIYERTLSFLRAILAEMVALK